MAWTHLEEKYTDILNNMFKCEEEVFQGHNTCTLLGNSSSSGQEASLYHGGNLAALGIFSMPKGRNAKGSAAL